jgi:hypothetical protein
MHQGREYILKNKINLIAIYASIIFLGLSLKAQIFEDINQIQFSGCYIAQQTSGEYVVYDPWNRELGRSLSLARATEIKINAENQGLCGNVQPPNPPVPNPPTPQPPVPQPPVPQPPISQPPNPQPPYPPYPGSDPDEVQAPSLYGYCGDYDYSQFRQAKNFAYSGSGLNYDDQTATQWALNYNRTHSCNTISEYAARYRALYNFAYSGSGLNYDSYQARDYALSKVETMSVDGAQFMFQRYRAIYNFGYSGAGLNLSSYTARNLGLEWLSNFCENQNELPNITSRFRAEYNFAYSGSGLNMDSRSARIYAADRVQYMSKCGFLIVKYSNQSL